MANAAKGLCSQSWVRFFGNLSRLSRQTPRKNRSEYRRHSETPRSPPNSLSYMCSPGQATAILPSRLAPLQSLRYGSDVGGWSSGKSSFFSPKHKSSVRCMRRATPMPFVATRRHRAMIRQWRKDPLARPRPYFPCRRSSSVEGKRERGAYRRSLPVYMLVPLGNGQLRAPDSLKNRRLSRQRRRARKEAARPYRSLQ